MLGSLAVGQLNLYFLLLTHGLLALTLISYRQGSLEERASAPLSPAAAEQRRRAATTFGTLLALLGLTLTVHFSCENLALFFLTFEASALPIFGVILFYGKRSPKFRAAAYLLYFTLLSGILPKLGFYGVVKCCLPLCGGALFGVAPALLSLALVGALAGSLATYRQLDLKKIIAYSSVVHMNLALVGYLSLSAVALQGALFLNFSHAVVSAGLFGAVGLLQDRTRTRYLPELSGLQSVMPLWSGAFLLLLLANAGLPGTVGFVGEAALLWGCFGAYPYLGFLLLLPMTLMGLRSYLLYTQLCWGVAPAFLNPAPLGVAAAPGSALLLRRWDLNPAGEGTALLLLGLWPNLLPGLLEDAAAQPTLRWLLAATEGAELEGPAAALALLGAGIAGTGPHRRRRPPYPTLGYHLRRMAAGAELRPDHGRAATG